MHCKCCEYSAYAWMQDSWLVVMNLASQLSPKMYASHVRVHSCLFVMNVHHKNVRPTHYHLCTSLHPTPWSHRSHAIHPIVSTHATIASSTTMPSPHVSRCLGHRRCLSPSVSVHTMCSCLGPYHVSVFRPISCVRVLAHIMCPCRRGP